MKSTSPTRPDVVKRGDDVTLAYRANADLSTATALQWLARKSPAGPVLLSHTATFVSVENGTSLVEVALPPASTAAIGTWLVEVEAVVDGRTRTFPSESYLRLQIIDDLS